MPTPNPLNIPGVASILDRFTPVSSIVNSVGNIPATMGISSTIRPSVINFTTDEQTFCFDLFFWTGYVLIRKFRKFT